MKKVLIISTSPRKGGNSDTLARHFAKGAAEAGNDVETVSLAGKKIEFCRGCFGCLESHRCVIHDYADEVRQKIHDADVVVWATPVYYYSCSGQMKVVIDRANPLYGSDYKVTDVYLLATAAENGPDTAEGTEKALQGWVDCFGRMTLKGVIFAGGVNDRGDIQGHAALREAYETARTIS